MTNARKLNVALSIDNSLYQEMQRQAEQSGSSLNALANQVLDQYVSVYRILEAEKCISIQGHTLLLLLDFCDEEKFSAIITQFLIDNIEFIQTPDRHNVMLGDILAFLQEYGILLGWYSYIESRMDSEGNANLVLGHSHGQKWSRILGTSISSLVEKWLYHSSTLLASPNRITIKIVLSTKSSH